MSPRGVLRKLRTTRKGHHFHSLPELHSTRKRRHPKGDQVEHELLCDMEIWQHERDRFTNNRTFRSPSKRRNPGSLRLRDEQRPEQQAQLSFRGSYTQEAAPKPVQDELHGLDHSLVIIKVDGRTTRLSLFHHFFVPKDRPLSVFGRTENSPCDNFLPKSRRSHKSGDLSASWVIIINLSINFDRKGIGRGIDFDACGKAKLIDTHSLTNSIHQYS